MILDPLAPLVELAGVADAIAAARAACEELRWHEAFRRRWREVRAESTVRSARASAAIEGARVSVEALRAAARGAAPAPVDAEGQLAFACLRAAAEVERLLPALGSRDRAAGPPFGQLLARLHTAASAGRTDLSTGDVGRPRGDAPPRDLAGLGPAPPGRAVAARLELLGELVRTSRAPALIVAAVVHGEVLALRPFVVGSGIVGRAAARMLVVQRGLDPTGSVVADVAWLGPGGLGSVGLGSVNAYLGAAAGFATGSPAGVAAWLIASADAVRLGADEARSIADLVLAS